MHRASSVVVIFSLPLSLQHSLIHISSAPKKFIINPLSSLLFLVIFVGVKVKASCSLNRSILWYFPFFFPFLSALHSYSVLDFGSFSSLKCVAFQYCQYLHECRFHIYLFFLLIFLERKVELREGFPLAFSFWIYTMIPIHTLLLMQGNMVMTFLFDSYYITIAKWNGYHIRLQIFYYFSSSENVDFSCFFCFVLFCSSIYF